MTTENQNYAGTTSALAQKTGIKPLAKIIAGVCAGIVALAAFSSIFGDSKGITILKNSVMPDLDPTITLGEAVERFCKAHTEQGNNYFEDPKEFIEKADKSLYRYGGPFNTFETTCGEEGRMESACVFHAFVKTRKAIWDDAGETSTGVRNVSVKFVDEGEVWIDAQHFSDSARKKLATQAAFYLPPVDEEKVLRELYEEQRDDWRSAYDYKPRYYIEWSKMDSRGFSASNAAAVYYLAYLLSERSEKPVGTEDMTAFLKAAVKDDEAKMKEILEKVWDKSSTEKERVDGISWLKNGNRYHEGLLKRFNKSDFKVDFDKVITSEDIQELCDIFSIRHKEMKEERDKNLEERLKKLKEENISRVPYFRVKGRREWSTINFHVYPDGRVSTEETDKLKTVYGK